MKKTFAQRWASPKKQAELEANQKKWEQKRSQPGKASWKTAPIAHIEKPLQFIRERATYTKYDEETKKITTHVSSVYELALEFARNGKGDLVQGVAQIINYNPSLVSNE